jgi:hypothetical protein
MLGNGAAMHYRFACGATSDAADGKVLPSPTSHRRRSPLLDTTAA